MEDERQLLKKLPRDDDVGMAGDCETVNDDMDGGTTDLKYFEVDFRKHGMDDDDVSLDGGYEDGGGDLSDGVACDYDDLCEMEIGE